MQFRHAAVAKGRPAKAGAPRMNLCLLCGVQRAPTLPQMQRTEMLHPRALRPENAEILQARSLMGQ